jgi:integrase
MGRVRKRRSARHGVRYLSVARLDGTDVTVGTFETFEDATDAWQRAEVGHRRGRTPLTAGRQSFAELVEDYFASAGLEATTRKAYRSHCTAHLLPRFGPRPLREIDGAAVGAWMNEQVKAGLSVRTRVATRSTLSSILQFAVDNGRLPHNPVAATRPPTRTVLHRRRPVLRPDQWPALRREFKDYGPETQLLVDLAIDTGLRFGEITDLRPEHLIDRGSKPYLKVQTVVVWPGEAYSVSGDVVERKHYTKGVEDRTVDLSAPVHARLREHIDRLGLARSELIFHAGRLREEHHAWRSLQDEAARAAFEASWQARLAAEPLREERFVLVRTDGTVRSGVHGRPNTFSLGCRCAHCTYANTAYGRARRQARRLAERGDATPRRRGPSPKKPPTQREPWLSGQWWGEIVWRPALERAGLSWLHWHDLRHAHATWLLAAGVPVRTVQRRLGHRHLTTTEIYLGELTDTDDVASYLGAYHDIFAAAQRGELWDADAEAQRTVLTQAKQAADGAVDVAALGELLAQLSAEQVAALFTAALTRQAQPGTSSGAVVRTPHDARVGSTPPERRETPAGWLG